MVGLIKTIFFLVIFYYLFRFIGRVLIPLFITNRVRKMQEQQSGYTRNNFRNTQDEGKVTIQKNSKNKKMTSTDMGEYVDYEEVK